MMPRSGLRFAMITTFFPPYHFGGDANYVRQLAEILARRGHEVDVIHDIDAHTLLNRGPTPEPLQWPQGITVHGLRSRWPGLSCLATQQLARPLVHGAQIKRILAERQPDIIHYHNVSLVGGPGVLAYGEGIKLYTAHEHWLVCPTHVLWRHNRQVCDERQCLRCVLNYRRPPQLWRHTGYLQRQAAHVDQFCSPSEFSAAKHRAFGFPVPMKVLPSFLPDVDMAKPPPLPAGFAGKPYFLFVGRLEKIKGLQDVIPRFRDIADAELWIAGSGDYAQVLQRLAGDARNIRFLGHQQADQLRGLYAHAVAVLMPSICYEVFPLVALEAFREGVPVIARALGPYPEIVDKSGGGLLFDSPEQLRDAIRQMIDNAPARQAMAAAAKQAYADHWSESAAMRAYFGLIGDIARRRGRQRVSDVLAQCDPAGLYRQS